MKYKIEFWGDTGRVHNARFAGEGYTNEVLIGLFCEDTDYILGEIESANSASSTSKSAEVELGDFITGKIEGSYIIIIPNRDYIQSKTYRVKTSELQDALKKWKIFQSKNRNGEVKSISISGSHEDAP